MDVALSPAQASLLERARAFRREVIEPADPHVREWIVDPDARFPWDIVEEGSRRGLRTLTVPAEYGGEEVGALGLSLAVEELAAGDMGVAVIFDQVWKIVDTIARLASSVQAAAFFPGFISDHRALVSIGVAEPDHATDVHMSRRLWEVEGRPVALSTTAEPDGEGWVIRGRKMMPSLGSTASTVLVMAQTEPERGIHDGCSYFLVPTDTPGFRVGTVWEKISQRLADNAELIFDDCRVPADALIGGRGRARAHPTTAGGNIEAAATTIGSARAAYEAAVGWARRRVQGGRPLVEHQAIGMLLAEMATDLEAARALTHKAALLFDGGDTTTPLQYMAKWHAAEAAIRVCTKAMEVFGGKGILLDNPVQKHLRDCLSFLHSDGTQQSRLLLIAQRLIDSGETALPPLA